MASSSSTTTLSCFFLVSSLLLLTLFNGATLARDVIEDSCKLVPKDSYMPCVTSLLELEDKGDMAMHSLASYTVSYTADLGMNISTNIKDMLTATGRRNMHRRDALRVCVEAYTTSVDSVIDAMASFEGERYPEAHFFLSQATFAPRACEQQFEREQNDAVSEVNTEFSRYIAVPLAFVSKVGGFYTPPEQAPEKEFRLM